jgi:hypothetical protein
MLQSLESRPAQDHCEAAQLPAFRDSAVRAGYSPKAPSACGNRTLRLLRQFLPRVAARSEGPRYFSSLLGPRPEGDAAR